MCESTRPLENVIPMTYGCGRVRIGGHMMRCVEAADVWVMGVPSGQICGCICQNWTLE